MKDLILLIVVVIVVGAATSVIIYHEYHYEPSFDIEPGETMVTITDIDMHQYEESDSISIDMELLNTTDYELPYLIFTIKFSQNLMPLLFMDGAQTQLQSGNSAKIRLKSDIIGEYNPAEYLELEDLNISYSERDVPFDVDLE